VAIHKLTAIQTWEKDTFDEAVHYSTVDEIVKGLHNHSIECQGQWETLLDRSVEPYLFRDGLIDRKTH
jgi:hypothetical protein